MRERLYGVDLVRFFSFLAIATHHVSWVYFYTTEIPVSPDSWVVALFEWYARSLAFSGFTIVGLTTVLLSLAERGPVENRRFYGFLLAGWFFFSAFIYWESPIPLAWDVYPLLFLGLLSFGWGSPRLSPGWFGVVGLVLLCIPFWQLEFLQTLPLWLRTVVVGDCRADIAEWAVLPWLGLVWLGCSVGTWARERGFKGASQRTRLGTREALIWIGLLFASVPFLGDYFQTPLGSEFSCYVYRRPPWVFWSHMIWPVFLVRLAWDPRVQDWLGSRKFCQWISSLRISRNFWLAYLVHYPLAYLIAVVARELGAPQSEYHPQWVALVAIGYLPFTEITCRVLLQLFPKARGWVGKSG